MASKRGELTTQQIVMMIVLITSFIILLLLLVRLNLGKETQKEICHNSIIMKSKGKGIIGNIDCKTNYVCISGGNDCQYMNPTATIKINTGHDEDGCHGNFAWFSGLGAVVNLTSSAGLEVDTGEKFDITATINGLVEAASDAVSLGFLPGRNDNGDFTFTVASYYDSLNVDAQGDAAPVVFSVTAPSDAGYYVLTADALTVNANFTFTFGNIEITVVSTGGNNPGDFITLMFYVGLTFGGVGALFVILVKKQKFNRFF